MRVHDKDVVEDLVIALLAVNQWSLEKAFAIRGTLAQQGLLDLDSLAIRDENTIAQQLDAAGHNRGDLNRLMARRLRALAGAFPHEKRNRLAELIQGRELG